MAVGVGQLDVGRGARGDRVIDADPEGLGHVAAGGEHLVEHDRLALGREHDDHAPRLKLEARRHLVGQGGPCALLVGIQHRERVLWNGQSAVGLGRVDLKVDRRPRDVTAKLEMPSSKTSGQPNRAKWTLSMKG